MKIDFSRLKSILLRQKEELGDTKDSDTSDILVESLIATNDEILDAIDDVAKLEEEEKKKRASAEDELLRLQKELQEKVGSVLK
ncbi:MAG: hypothetical protein MJ171_00140 [Clostridia bacterium]|nr:hypothetical protein [Clostridia bacterium]